MLGRKSAPGVGFQIFFEGSRFFTGAKSNRRLYSPGPIFGSMRNLACIVRVESGFHIFRKPCVVANFIRFADQDVNVMKFFLCLSDWDWLARLRNAPLLLCDGKARLRIQLRRGRLRSSLRFEAVYRLARA